MNRLDKNTLIVALGIVLGMIFGMIGAAVFDKQYPSLPFVIAAMPIVITTLLSFFCLYRVKKNTVVLHDRKVFRDFFKEDLWLFRWSKEYHRLMLDDWHKTRIIDYSERRGQIVKFTLHPLTDNPKVLDFTICVVFKTGGTPEKALQVTDRVRALGVYHEKDVVEFYLFELTQKHSRALATLYNPRDQAQQQKFREIVQPFLDTNLAGSGIEVTELQFNLAA